MRTLFPTVLLSLFFFSSTAVYADAKWSLDENSGQTTQDSGGNNLDLTLNNMSASNWVAGKAGSALSFNGSNQDVSTTNATLLQTPSVTISAWIKPDQTTTSWEWIAAQGDNYGLYLNPWNNSATFYLHGSSWNWPTVNTPANSFVFDQWQHIAGSFDAATQTMRIYVNGVEVGSSTIGQTINYAHGTSFTLGSMQGGRLFEGSIDEVQVYDRALSNSEITQLSNNVSGGGTSDTTAPVITLNGSNPVSITVGFSYTDAGATALDNVDGSINVTVDDSAVNTSVAGSYAVQFSASDAAGNSATTTRTVNVTANTHASDLLAQWLLDENSGSAAADTSGNNHSLTLNNMSGSNWVTGNSGSALSFNGSNQSASTADASALQTPSLTISAWVKPDQTSVSWEWIAAQGDNYGLFLNPGNNSATFYLHDTSWNWSAVNTPDNGFVFGQWQHIAGTFDTATQTMRIYVNGVEAGSNTIGQTINYTHGTGFTLGSMQGGRLFDGSLDQVQVYGTALPVTEIAQLASTSNTPNTTPDTTAPVITLNGSNPVSITVGTTYTDAGASALDNVDGTVNVTVDSSAVNSSFEGSYTVQFSATDAAGNTATATRTVNIIEDTTAPVSAELIARWALDEGTGATANDQTSNGIHLTLNNMSNSHWVAGHSNSALNFEGSNQHASTATASVLQTPSLTLSAWIKPDSTSAFWEWIAAQGDNYGLYLNPGNKSVTFYLHNENWGWDTITTSANSFSFDEWQHVVGSFDASTKTMKVYVDGIEAGSTTIGTGIKYAHGNGFTIGSMNGDRFFDGSIDEVQLYDKALTASEIALLGGLAGTEDTTPPLITINGDNPASITLGTTYTDSGASALDDEDGVVNVTIDATAVNSAVEGSYTVQFSASDAAGNTATAIRTVNVVPLVGPPPPSTPSSVEAYGLTFKTQLTASEISTTSLCNVEKCGQSAIDLGAYYYIEKPSNDYGKVIAYYDSDGKYLGTTILGSATTPGSTGSSTTASYPIGSGDSTAQRVGYLAADFAVSASGAATYTVPIAIPPGSAGVQPEISLNYNSQGGEGVAGLGWSLSGLSSISRCPKTRATDGVVGKISFDASDEFCLDGQRLILVSGTHGANNSQYKTEIDSYSTVTVHDTNNDQQPESFTVTTKAGETMEYGTNWQSRLGTDWSEAAINIIDWGITELKDRKGNYIQFRYLRTGDLKNERQPFDIQYTGNSDIGQMPFATIKFNFQNRTQDRVSYIDGKSLINTQLLKSIDVKLGDNLVRTYSLKYHAVDTKGLQQQDRLKMIEECVGINECLPATYFVWDGAHTSNIDFEGASSLAGRGGSIDPYAGSITPLPIEFYSPGDDFFAAEDAGSPSFKTSQLITKFGWEAEGGGRSKWDFDHSDKLVGDVNGDGLSDIVAVTWEPVSSDKRRYDIEVVLSTGDSFVSNNFDTSRVSRWETIRTDAKFTYPTYLADVNGDGLSDLVRVNFSNVTVSLSDGSSFLTPVVGLPETFSLANWRADHVSGAARFVQDVNADGYADFIGIDSSGVKVALSNGSNKFEAPTVWISDFRSGNGWDYYSKKHFVQLADVNGDGLSDIVGFGDDGVRVAVNDAKNNRFIASVDPWINDFGYLSGGNCYFWSEIDSEGNVGITSTPPSFPVCTPSGGSQEIRSEISPECDDNDFGSDNGYSLPQSCYHRVVSYTDDGGEDIYTNTHIKHQKVYGWNFENNPRTMGDVNGDGLADIVGFGDNGVYVSYSTGSAFTPAKKVITGMGYNAGGWKKENPRHVLDLNGDGLADILGFANARTLVYLSKGQQGFYDVDDETTWITAFNKNAGWTVDQDIRTFGDFNGDGLLDIVGINDKGITIGENKTEPQRITRIVSGGVVTDPATQDGLNRSIDILYDKLTSKLETSSPYRASYNEDLLDSNSAIKKGLTPALFVVAKHYSSNGELSSNAARQASMSYFYKGFDVDRETYRGSLGFAQRTVRDGISGAETTTQYYQDYPFIGSPKKTVTKSSDGKTLSVSYNTLDSNQDSNHPKIYQVYSLSSKELNYAYTTTNGIYKTTETINSEPDSCGNIGTITTKVSDAQNTYTKVTSNTYAQELDCFKRSRLMEATVTSTSTEPGAGSQSRTSSFTYTAAGQIYTETIEPGDTLALTTTYVYDDYGNIVNKTLSGTGIESRITSYNYTDNNAQGRYAAKTTTTVNGAERHVTRTHDPRFGTVTGETDPNGLTTSTLYNAFGQKYQQTSATGEVTHIAYAWCNFVIHNSRARYCTTTTSQSGGYSKVYYDQIDRVLRTATIGLGKGSGSTIVYQDKNYNLETGQLVEESRPYYSDELPEWTKYTYDALERPKTITQPAGLVSSVGYDGLTTTKTVVNGNTTITTKQTLNAEGKKARVTDALDNTINYAYYADGNLRQTTVTASDSGDQTAADTSQAITSFSYDKLGNKTGMVDPDMGIWSYTYYPTGELKSQINANGQNTTMTYDNLGRIKTRVEAEGTYNWYYDDAPGKGIGKLHRITGPGNYEKSFSYNNELGQVESVSEQLPASINSATTTAYTTTTSYDLFGRVDTLTYPLADSFNPVVVKHHYTRGALTRISDKAETINYWEAKQTEADGSLISEELGNGVKTAKGYDAQGRITQIYSGKTSSGTDLQQLTYGFDGAGNLKWRDDNNQLKEKFEYDALYRLKKTTNTYKGSVIPGNSNSYDGHGNITEKDGIHYSYETGGEKGGLHAVSKIGNNTYTYDKNGNMLTGGMRSYTWTSFDKPSRIEKIEPGSEPKKIVNLAYNADRQRIIKDGNHETTWYVGGGLRARQEKSRWFGDS